MHVITLFANKSCQSALDDQLRGHGMEVVAARSIDEMLQLLRGHLPDALVLEDAGPMLEAWLSILKQLREGTDLPIFVVGTPNGIGIVEAMALGADDYLDCEMPVDQLVVRLGAHVTKRASVSQVTQVGPITLSDATMTIRHGSVEIGLTPREYSLARLLFRSVGRVVPLYTLSARVWGASVDISKRTLEQHIYKLRRKFDAHFSPIVRIQAAYGIGYRLDLIAAGPDGWEFPASTGAAKASIAWDGVERRRSNKRGSGQGAATNWDGVERRRPNLRAAKRNLAHAA